MKLQKAISLKKKAGLSGNIGSNIANFPLLTGLAQHSPFKMAFRTGNVQCQWPLGMKLQHLQIQDLISIDFSQNKTPRGEPFYVQPM